MKKYLLLLIITPFCILNTLHAKTTSSTESWSIIIPLNPKLSRVNAISKARENAVQQFMLNHRKEHTVEMQSLIIIDGEPTGKTVKEDWIKATLKGEYFAWKILNQKILYNKLAITLQAVSYLEHTATGSAPLEKNGKAKALKHALENAQKKGKGSYKEEITLLNQELHSEKPPEWLPNPHPLQKWKIIDVTQSKTKWFVTIQLKK